MRFVMVVVAVLVYILFVSVRGTVYVVHRSHVGWCREVARIRRGIFLGIFSMSVGVAIFVIGT